MLVKTYKYLEHQKNLGGKKKKKVNILRGSERVFLIGKLKDVQLGAGFHPFLVLATTEKSAS